MSRVADIPARESVAGDSAWSMAPKIALRDGSAVLVRQVVASDTERIRAVFERLSAGSRFRRFLASVRRLSDSALRRLTEVDHRDHEALIALDLDSRDAVGVARFIRTNRPDVAEVAVTVADEWQGNGIGTALLTLLAARAREEGIARFTGVALATNGAALSLLRSVGPVTVMRTDASTIELEADIRGSTPHGQEQPGAGDGPDAQRPLAPALIP
jgi:GNAT superfamily N-acetyltransferase